MMKRALNVLSAAVTAALLSACGAAAVTATPGGRDQDLVSPLTSPITTPVPVPENMNDSTAVPPNPDAVTAAQQALAQKLQIDPSGVTVISYEKVVWPDGCLGVQIPDTMCLQALTPGYKVMLEAQGQQYEYHTDQTGRQVILASPRP